MEKESCEQTDPNNSFYTFDLGLASVLVALQHEIICIDKTERKKVKFIFQDSEELGEATEKYWKNEIKINARTLFESQKMLKNRIYSD